MNPRFWKVSAGHTGSARFWKYFRQNGIVAVGHSSHVDLTHVRTEEQIGRKLRHRSGNVRRQLGDFVQMNTGDVVACYLAPARLVGIGLVEDGEYLYEPGSLTNGYDYAHQKRVVWLRQFGEKRLRRWKSVYRELRVQKAVLEITSKPAKRRIQTWIQSYLKKHPSERQTVGRVRKAREREETPIPSVLPVKRRGSVLSTSTIDESATWGMERAMVFERSERREPEDVSTKPVGYDIDSRDSKGRIVRQIEVKARRSSWPVVLTENEYRTAKRLGEDYFLYVITGDKRGKAVYNPIEKCTIKKKDLVVYEVVDWRKKGEDMRIP